MQIFIQLKKLHNKSFRLTANVLGEFKRYKLIPFIKTNGTKNERIIVCFRGLKKSRILIVILGFLSPLKRTIIRAFSVISFYKWY